MYVACRFVKTFARGTGIIMCHPQTSIRDFKLAIHKKWDIPPCKQRLLFAGKDLSHVWYGAYPESSLLEKGREMTMEDYHITDESTLHLVLRTVV